MDGAKMFLDHFKISEKDFVDYGIQSIIYSDPDMAHASFLALKKIINEKLGDVYVRPFGRIVARQNELLNFYRTVLGITDIKFDPTNNSEPSRYFSSTSNISKTNISNYKLSHIWGRTKNPFAFCAGWNLCYTPIFIDPFTGHETKGSLANEFNKRYRNHALKLFKQPISEFNTQMLALEPQIKDYLKILNSNSKFTDNDKKEISKCIIENFSTIDQVL